MSKTPTRISSQRKYGTPEPEKPVITPPLAAYIAGFVQKKTHHNRMHKKKSSKKNSKIHRKKLHKRKSRKTRKHRSDKRK